MKKIVGLFVVLLCCASTAFSQQSKYDSLENIVDGSISVYRSRTENYYIERNDTLYFLPKVKQQITYVNGVRSVKTMYPYRGFLNYFLKSCEKTTQLIRGMSLSDTDLVKLMKKYYECIGETPKYMERRSERSLVTLGVVTGFNRTTMDVFSDDRSVDEASWNASSKLMAGLSAEAVVIKSNIAFGAQFNFVTYDLSGASRYFIGTSEVINTFETKLTQIQFQVYFKKYFGQGTFKGYFKVGPGYNLNANVTSKRVRTEKLNTGPEFKSETDPYYTPRNLASVHAAVGASKKLGDKLWISAELRGETINRINDRNVDGDELYVTPITLQFGVNYRIF